MTATRRHFAFAGEGAYSLPLATAVAGLVSNLGGEQPVDIWILDLGLEPKARPRLDAVIRRHARCEVVAHWLAVSSTDIRDLPASDHFTSAAYARLLLPALLPDEVATAVFLDCDVVVCRDLTPLVDLRLSQAPLAAVQDFVVETIGSERSGVARLSSRPPGAKYFNSGVLAFNLPVWRETSLSDRIFACAQQHSPLRYPDQDALNAIVDDWHELELQWNVQSRIFWLDDAADSDLILELRRSRNAILADARVIHFTGPSKPWEPWYRNPKPDLWRRALLRSGALSPAELAGWGLRYYPERTVGRTAITVHRALSKRARALARPVGAR